MYISFVASKLMKYKIIFSTSLDEIKPYSTKDLKILFGFGLLLLFNVPVNNLSVILGRSYRLLGIYQYFGNRISSLYLFICITVLYVHVGYLNKYLIYLIWNDFTLSLDTNC